MEKHTAIYLRVSSKQQEFRSQEADLKQHAKAVRGPVVWYRDKFTGKTMERPGWQRLEADIARGEVSAVVCWRFDRLGRTAKGLTALIDDLHQRKVNLVSLRDGVTLDTPAGRMIANVLASLAQYETEIRAERVLAGQAAAKAAGKTWGGSRKGRRLKVTDEQLATIKRMLREGAPVAAIARATGLTRPTVYAHATV